MIITLIGMPGSGKSTAGRILAMRLGYSFIDIDERLEKRRGKTLHEILETEGDSDFLKDEEEEVLALEKIDNAVISPGGSIVYCADAMRKLCGMSKVIFLDVPLATIKERVGSEPRGIVGLGEKGISGIYSEREVLYRKYADETIEAEGLDAEGVAERIQDLLLKLPSP
jgi:shikimate kinase